MKTTVGLVAIVAILALTVPMTWSQQGIDPLDRIGEVSFPISCKPAVQKPFDQAVAILHSFWYLESELGQPGPAVREYEASLKRAPNRFKTIAGVARAAELSGDRAKARVFYTRLVALAKPADSDRPELKQAKSFLAAAK